LELPKNEIMTVHSKSCLLLLFSLLFVSVECLAQVEVNSDLTIEEYVNDILLGSGIQAFNITFQGGESQLGYLTNGEESFSIGSGLVLSNDVAVNLACPEVIQTCDGCLGMGFNDPDLLDIANSVPPLIGQNFLVTSVNDGCILEFDFIAAGDSISFDYVFGSDEYEAWVNTQYNDVFAFFLSGPGIVGPYDSPAGFPNGSVNIAGVPDTDPMIPITISSVNSSINSEYFFLSDGEDDFCINGYTVPFTASHEVECGETYHIKLAIADGSDTVLESVVVLEEGSFQSNAVVQIDLSIDVGGPEANTIYEDCGLATLIFERPVETILEFQEMVYINYGNSEAINGVDYGQPQLDGSLLPLPDSVIFDPFVSVVSFELVAEIDFVEEGPELVEMQIENVAACNGGGLTTYFSFFVAENPPPFIVEGYETEMCIGDFLEISPIVEGGYGNYTYNWVCSGETSEAINISPTEDYSCEIIVGDTCGLAPESVVIDVVVLDFPPLSASIDQDEVTLECNDTQIITSFVEGGDTFYTYEWEDETGNDLFPWFDPSELSLSTWSGAQEVFLTVTDGCGFEATDSIDVVYNIPAIVTDVPLSLDVLCNDPFSVSASASGTGPFNYTWFNGNTWLNWGETLNWATDSDANLTLEVSDGCGQMDNIDIEIIVEAPDVEFTLTQDLIGPCTEIFDIQSDVMSGSGGYVYNWTQDGSALPDNGSLINLQSTETTSISLTINDGCGQSATESTTVVIDNPALVVELGPDVFASCADNSEIVVDIVSGAGSYSYSWIVNNELFGTEESIFLQSYVSIPIVVNIEDGCGGVSSDSLSYIIPDVPLDIQITPSTTICAGDGISLEATAQGGEDGFVYFWPSLDTYGPIQYISPGQSASYQVIATDICGDAIDASASIDVQYLFSDFVVSAIEGGENTYQFRATPSPVEPFPDAYAYAWDFGDGFSAIGETVIHSFDGLGDYTVSLDITSLSGCTNSSYTMVRGPVLLYVPTAFTPNNDGINDAFEVIGSQIKEYELWIFNRWGETVFHSETIQKAWLGDVQGGAHYAENGIYNWVIRLKGFNTEAEEFSGTLQLMR
jgi:gliding motility-associated-like protein